MNSPKDFETMSEEEQQDFLELAELYKGLTADQQKQILEQLNESRLRRLIDQGSEIVEGGEVEDLTAGDLSILKKVSGNDRAGLAFNTFLIGVALGYEAVRKRRERAGKEE